MFLYALCKITKKHFLANETIVPHPFDLKIGSDAYKNVHDKVMAHYLSGEGGSENLDNIYKVRIIERFGDGPTVTQTRLAMLL